MNAPTLHMVPAFFASLMVPIFDVAGRPAALRLWGNPTTLHAHIRRPITRDLEQTPQFGPMRSVQQEDGEYLLVRTEGN